jgi:hypothetical protein
MSQRIDAGAFIGCAAAAARYQHRKKALKQVASSGSFTA